MGILALGSGHDDRMQGGVAGLRVAAFAVRKEHMGRAGEWHGELERLPSTPCGTRGGQGGSGLCIGTHLITRTFADAGQDGIRTGCPRRRGDLVDDLVDS
jgi:hypothetical protein